MKERVTNMKIDRAIGIINEILKRDRVTVKELAEKFEVSVRTIHRDIDGICMAGIPVVSYRGGHGGISIMEGFKMDKSALTKDELNNIILGLKSITSIQDNNNINILIDKLSPSDTASLSINDTIIDLSSFYKGTLSEKITIIRDSIEKKNLIEFEYFSSRGKSVRKIEPYILTFQWNEWYVLGFCKLREDFRLFKLKRMVKLMDTEKLYVERNIPEHKKDFNLMFKDKNKIKVITALVHRSLEYMLVDSYGIDSYEVVDKDTLKFSFEYVNFQWALRYVLSFGSKMKVIEPEEIVEAIKGESKKMFEDYNM
ncbi:helix-turn-helix transcriptional regulator [Oceanirhabdus seepicola]|uniref:YafY family transcriptional regulator n=1 Tax=Oceanirhabdus seepicola TaxID=2828781 RepID=A0A9J6P566_9CLOT|nr:YafY family protein [Oceanirhabdus seepicola]MCM1991938.1 YafY family transcriptional regulator [Oceanirhabdus seepicola]